MVKYEFMRAHGRGSENKGAAKQRGGVRKKEVRKKGGARTPRTPP